MATSRSCAYCGKSTPLTREHLWPRGIIARAKHINTSYFGKLEKFIDAELTIKDVCAECNNGPLSDLDAYICRLFDAQFNRPAIRRQARTFVYDYEPLLRWLLKISFNTARANESDAVVLARYKDFMLKGGNPPLDIQVSLELVFASRNPNWRPGSADIKEIPAVSIRCARIEPREGSLPEATLRLVSIYGFYFWIAIANTDAGIGRLPVDLPGKCLSANRSKVSLYPTRGMLELHADWARNPRALKSLLELSARRAG